MCDDSFNVATVPRHAVFGQAGSGDGGDDESTLGDRFFVRFHFNFFLLM